MSTSAPNIQYCCRVCKLLFANRGRRQKHLKKTHPPCGVCKKRFVEREQLQDHQREENHLYCEECNICFAKPAAHVEHVRAVQHDTQYHCCDCDRDYNAQLSLDTHCCDCDKVFPSRAVLQRHFTKHAAHVPRVKDLRIRTDPRGPPKCKKCGESFPTKKELKTHKLEHKPPRHIPCPVGPACKKKFITPSGLLDHLESGRCHSGMTRAKLHDLVTAHDQSHHITDTEAAGVVSSIAQESFRYSTLLFLLQALQANSISQSPHNTSSSILASLTRLNLIGKESNARIDDETVSEWSILDEVPVSTALSDNGSDWSVLGGAPLQPVNTESGSDWSLVSPIHTPTTFNQACDINDLDQMSQMTFLQALKCPRCPPDRRPFGSSAALNAHVSSAAHAPKIFHCPLAFALDAASPANKLKMERRFKTLGGLARHLESGACRGGAATFVNVMTYVQDQLRLLGFESVKLLLD